MTGAAAVADTADDSTVHVRGFAARSAGLGEGATRARAVAGAIRETRGWEIRIFRALTFGILIGRDGQTRTVLTASQ